MRIKSVEFWRIIFAISIVLCHSMYLPTNKGGVNLHVNSLGVEFFFILSGFFMAREAYKEITNNSTLGGETISFLSKKLKPIYVIFLISSVFELLARFLLRSGSANGLIYNIWDLLFLRIFGFGQGVNLLVGASWFLFALFPAMGILYPLLRKYTNNFLYIIAPLISCFILGWFSRVYGHVNFAFHLTQDKLICLGLLRAISEICVGCVAYLIYEKIKTIFDYKKLSLLFIIFEVTSFITVLLLAIYGSRSQTDFLAILLISIGIIISFSGKGIDVFFCNIENKWISIMSQYSICLYLNHYVWLRTLQNWKLKISFYSEISIYFILSVLTALLCLVIFRKINIYFNNKLKNI